MSERKEAGAERGRCLRKLTCELFWDDAEQFFTLKLTEIDRQERCYGLRHSLDAWILADARFHDDLVDVMLQQFRGEFHLRFEKEPDSMSAVLPLLRIPGSWLLRKENA